MADAGRLPSRFPVENVAVECVAKALQAATALHHHRGAPTTVTTLDRGHVAAAVLSERHFRRPDQPAGGGFATLSRFWPTSDGWVRTHANYPWHRRALVTTLGTTEDTEAVAAAVKTWRADELEEAVFAAGGVAGAVRSLDAWRAHPQGQALAGEPLVGHRVTGQAAPRVRSAGDLPASGVRVLDLTRVIAGPVCTRYLGALGADVLRLDPPQHLDLRLGDVADTLLAKRSALLDLRSPTGLAGLHGLLDQADVVVCGYRPGALDRFGLTEDALAERHPGLVVVFISAWGHSGPWAARRGFDSIVQAPTGIARHESVNGDEPGVLPCQLLDHGTGYLAAAAALDGLRRQSAEGGTHVHRLSLARTAGWLTSAHPDGRGTDETTDESQWLTEVGSPVGPVTAVRPPGSLGGRPLAWPFTLSGYGNDAPEW